MNGGWYLVVKCPYNVVLLAYMGLLKRLNSFGDINESKEIFVKHKCDKGIKHRYWEIYYQRI